MKFLDWAAIGGIVAVVAFTGRVAWMMLKAGYTFAKTWENVVQSVKDLVSEVKDIKHLLQEGRDWMARGDEKFKRHDDDIQSLRSDVNEHKERLAKLEGREE